MEYMLVEQNSNAGLVELVTIHLEKGWELWGDPFAWETQYDMHYCQAMVRFGPDGRPVVGKIETALREKGLEKGPDLDWFQVPESQVPETPTAVERPAPDAGYMAPALRENQLIDNENGLSAILPPTENDFHQLAQAIGHSVPVPISAWHSMQTVESSVPFFRAILCGCEKRDGDNPECPIHGRGGLHG